MKRNLSKNNKINIFAFVFIIVTCISVAIRINGVKFESLDMIKCLYKWFEVLKNNGGLNALALNIGDYNMPYMTIMALLTYLPISPLVSIKAVSIIFDFLLAISCVKLTKELLKNRYNEKLGLLVYSIIILLPTVILNSSYWGQCDSIYATFIIMSLVYLIREKYLISFIFLGISFAFKLQFIFILPLYVLYFLAKRKLPIYYFLIIPMVNFIMCLPSVVFGKNILDCIRIYFNQTGEYNNKISLNFPGIYNFFYDTEEFSNEIPLPNEYLPKIMIIILGLIFIGIALYVIIKKVKFDNNLIIETALWSVMITTFLLPYMHDRYMFVADVLSVIYCIINGSRKIYVPICINLCSAYTYIAFLDRVILIDIKYISIINCLVVVLLTKNVLSSLKKNAITISHKKEVIS